uniref:Putative secreted protein n=1 Tax=Anopheles triannulatus TaxID=58253 RepID=A0A2M4B366_9DIPT
MMALWLCSVPKLSSSDAVCVVILPETPEILYRRSPSSCTELYRIRQLSSNRPFSSSGSSSAMADSAYRFTIRWPALAFASTTEADLRTTIHPYHVPSHREHARTPHAPPAPDRAAMS